jgi:hypothetical protein
MRRANLWLVAVLLLAGLSLWLGRRNDAAAPADESPKPTGATRSFAPAPAEPIHLVILNGTGEVGLAGRMSLALAAAGCVVERIGDAPHAGYATCLLINRRLSRARAHALAELLGGVTVLREWDARTAEDAVLVLGEDHERIWERLRNAPPGGAP